MSWLKLDLKEELQKRRTEHVLEEVKHLFEQEAQKEQAILDRLKQHGGGFDRLSIDALDPNRLYRIETIRELAIDYRLKFLSSDKFKGEFPHEVIFETKRLEAEHQTTFENMYVLAPKKYYVLEDCDGDPLLFTKVSDTHYYLIAKWGNDLSIFRKWLLWPMKSIENSIKTIVVFAALTALLLPEQLLLRQHTPDAWIYRVIFFIQCLFIYGSLGLMYTLAFNRNTSEKEWNSKYFNG